jgi:hypothetical protein
VPSRCCGLQKWREAKAQLEGVLGGCGGPGQPHELHVHCVDCRTPLLNCCNAAGDTKGALAHLTVMISAMRAILGDLKACQNLALARTPVHVGSVR